MIDIERELIMKWDVIIQLSDCEIKGNDIIYHMSSEFTQFFLGHKHTLKLGFPEQVQVQGNKLLTFERKGLIYGADLYTNGDFRLLIKYR